MMSNGLYLFELFISLLGGHVLLFLNFMLHFFIGCISELGLLAAYFLDLVYVLSELEPTLLACLKAFLLGDAHLLKLLLKELHVLLINLSFPVEGGLSSCLLDLRGNHGPSIQKCLSTILFCTVKLLFDCLSGKWNL